VVGFLRTAVLVGAVLGLGITGMLPAAAASARTARYTAGATGYQNDTIAQALANNPAGRRISASQIEWNDGTVVMAVPVTPDASSPPCPSTFTTHWTCVYSGTNWTGTQLEFKDQGYYQDLYAYGGSSWHTWSFDNELRQRTWLNQYADHAHSGASLCMSPHAISANSVGPWSRDRWIYLSTNGNPC